MFKFDLKLSTTKKDRGVNKKRYIIFHHTPWSFKGNCNVLSGHRGIASCHFVAGQKWEMAKIGEPNDILRHAWSSARGAERDLNDCSLWIECCFNLESWRVFPKKQFDKVVELAVHLMRTYNIPKENVLTHTMITNGWTLTNVRKKNYVNSIAKKYYKFGDMCRKVDVHHNFWQKNGFTSFRKFQDYLGSLV